MPTVRHDLQKGPALRKEGGVLFLGLKPIVGSSHSRVDKQNSSVLTRFIYHLLLSEIKTDRTMKHIQLSLFGLLASSFILSGCGNIDIVKRRHMPGYHVEVNKNMKYEKAAKDDTQVAQAEQQHESAEVRDTQVTEMAAVEEVITASAEPSIPVIADKKKQPTKLEDKKVTLADFTSFDFLHELKTTKHALKTAAPAGDTHWMAWVAFGAGLGAAFFGLIGLIVAFFGVPLWWLAIIFGAAAIVFAILHSKKGYSGERFRKLGLLFGIIGAGLGVVGMIIWIIGVAGGFGRGRYWR